jgi:hypothetical protein
MKRLDEIECLEKRANPLTLDSNPSPVNQPHLLKPAGVGFHQVITCDVANFSGPEWVEIEYIGDGNLDRGFRVERLVVVHRPHSTRQSHSGGHPGRVKRAAAVRYFPSTIENLRFRWFCSITPRER